MKHEQMEAALTKAGLPLPAGALVDAAYRMATDDWYAKTADGWFWWDARHQEWKAAPMGPLV